MKLLKKSGALNQNCPWLDREWLETDGRGGYCSMAVPLCGTRKYHGLLVTGLENFEGRYALLSGYEIAVSDAEGRTYRLDTSQYPGTISPAGFLYLEEFDNSVLPSWRFRCGETVIAVEIFMAGDSGVYLSMEKQAGETDYVKIALSPIIAYRDSHAIAKENASLSFKFRRVKSSCQLSFYERMPALYFSLTSDFTFTTTGFWLKNREYLREMERGFDFREDCFVPGAFSFELKNGEKEIIRCALSPVSDSGSKEPGGEEPALIREVYENEKASRKALRRKFKGEPPVIRILKQESRHFFARNRDNNLSVIAGYPWFGEWGRDTMISLYGLTECCGRIKDGIEILKAYASYIRDGLLPNTLGGTQGFESYNSIDAGLLYTMAAQQLWNTGKVKKEIKSAVFPAVEKILKAYLEERVSDLVISSAGFPEAGNESTQLTWMDAKSGGRPVTPRGGSPVEITALYYNALKFYLEMLSVFGGKNDTAAFEAAKKIEKNFIDSYWIEEGGYLADVVKEGRQDRSVRPNMLFALALPFPLVDREKGKKIMEIVERELLTSCGLRTLSASDNRFCGVYQGNGESRDSCYHQGTVWPWLFGVYTDASLYAADEKKAKAEELGKMILAFVEKHIDECGIGFVSEIFDGKEPLFAEGKGAYAQAWSSAELIRAWEKINQVIKNS